MMLNSITTVIRSYNEAGHLATLLPMLNRQSIPNDIIIVDSFSKDNTVKVAEEHGAKIVQCKDFTYGKGLNIGAKNSNSAYICALSAHCFPTNDNFLLVMKGAFEDRAAGVYARQLPVKESNILDKRNLALIFREEKIIQVSDIFFNNAASMFRRDIWEKFKFDEKVCAFEDLLWARAVQGAGYKIIYEPRAMIHHYHDELVDTTIARYCKEFQVLEKIFAQKL